MPSKLLSAELHGLEGFLVEIEIDRRPSNPKFIIVGLPDAAVQEAKERVTSAIKNSGLDFPRGKVIVNLAPADLKKAGPRYDLPIAIGIIALMKQVSIKTFHETIMIGELALDGNIRPINGILASVEFAKKQGFKKILLPKENANEAALISGIDILPASHLTEAIQLLNDHTKIPKIEKPIIKKELTIDVDMASIRGQAQAKRAMEIAAAGSHNVLLSGTPGAGKTMMAKALSGILPSMSIQEMLDVSKIYSIAGLLPKNQPLITNRPFRSVHHTASGMSIVGGGNMPGPGEISLAHRGVLLMDEIAEFPKNVLEVLRQPMEDKVITVSRVRGTCTYPCQFTLIATMNPCPCGFRNAENTNQICNCSATHIQRYEKRLSGPLIDRIDLHINVNPVKHDQLIGHSNEESSATIKKRVETARKIQMKRFKTAGITCNAEMKNKEIQKHCPLDEKSKTTLSMAVDQMNLSARGYFRVLKVARTIADLEGKKEIVSAHIAEALQYRTKIF